ncbi:hypothetical protein, partial [Acidaminococcus timonensis]|uniref:hypothetical protein n=1 Tax=Acidaminococcus timonensis TaxID=1871002 RepID=UPI003077D590
PLTGENRPCLLGVQQAPGGGFSSACSCWLAPAASSLEETEVEYSFPSWDLPYSFGLEKDEASIHCARTFVNKILNHIFKSQYISKKVLHFE